MDFHGCSPRPRQAWRDFWNRDAMKRASMALGFSAPADGWVMATWEGL